MSAEKHILFICGVGRSGTTALRKLINAHPRALIGGERYNRMFAQGKVTAAQFEKEAFLNIKEGETSDTKLKRFEPYEKFSKLFDKATVIGDKIPTLYKAYNYLWDEFPTCRVLYIVRNPVSVAESYQSRSENKDDPWNKNAQSGIRDWNKSVRRTLAEIKGGRDIKVASFEKIFSSTGSVRKVIDAVGLDSSEMDQSIVEAEVNKAVEIKGKKSARDEDVRQNIMLTAAINQYRELINDHCILTQRA